MSLPIKELSQMVARAELGEPDTAVDLSPNDRVDLLEAAIVAQLPAVRIEPVHYFADGLYAREITIPSGTVLTGKVHRTRHLNILSRGTITVWSEAEGTKQLTAPATFVAEAGSRRVGYAHTDVVWTTVHATSETDLEKLETDLIEPHRNPHLVAKDEQPALPVAPVEGGV